MVKIKVAKDDYSTKFSMILLDLGLKFHVNCLLADHLLKISNLIWFQLKKRKNFKMLSAANLSGFKTLSLTVVTFVSCY